MSRIRIRDVQEAVARRYGVTVPELRSGARPPRISGPRAVAFWLARRLTCQSLPQIGRMFRKRHSAVHYGVRKVERARGADEGLARELAALEQAIRETAA